MTILTRWRQRPAIRSLRRDVDGIVGSPPLRGRFVRFLDKVKDAAGLSTLVERHDAYVIRLDLPGVRERDIDIRVDLDMLTVSGERRHEEAKRERGYEYRERSYESFTRTIELPRDADTTKVDADLRNGVLEVHLPKGGARRTRQIPIERREGRELGRRERGRERAVDRSSQRAPQMTAHGNGGP